MATQSTAKTESKPNLTSETDNYPADGPSVKAAQELAATKMKEMRLATVHQKIDEAKATCTQQTQAAQATAAQAVAEAQPPVLAATKITEKARAKHQENVAALASATTKQERAAKDVPLKQMLLGEKTEVLEAAKKALDAAQAGVDAALAQLTAVQAAKTAADTAVTTAEEIVAASSTELDKATAAELAAKTGRDAAVCSAKAQLLVETTKAASEEAEAVAKALKDKQDILNDYEKS